MGDDVDFYCEVIGDTKPLIHWSKVNGDMDRNVHTYENILRVNSVVPENEGVYRCTTTYEADYSLTIQGMNQSE